MGPGKISSFEMLEVAVITAVLLSLLALTSIPVQNVNSYQVALVNQFGVPYCSGSLINEHFVLTAAHCKNDFTSRSRVVVGAKSFWSPGESRQERPSFIQHENYDEASHADDIALI